MALPESVEAAIRRFYRGDAAAFLMLEERLGARHLDVDSHPAIRCEGEILSTPRALPTVFVLRRSATARFTGADAYGFKLLTHHVGLQGGPDPADYLRRIYNRGFRLIVLERRDWLQQAVSSLRASATQYHYRKADRTGFSPMRVDPMVALRYE